VGTAGKYPCRCRSFLSKGSFDAPVVRELRHRVRLSIGKIWAPSPVVIANGLIAACSIRFPSVPKFAFCVG
jgi:hypothetical protein